MNDTEIISAANSLSNIGGMTVNERLYLSGLMEEFDRALKFDRPKAEKILKALRVDEPSIRLILK